MLAAALYRRAPERVACMFVSLTAFSVSRASYTADRKSNAWCAAVNRHRQGGKEAVQAQGPAAHARVCGVPYAHGCALAYYHLLSPPPPVHTATMSLHFFIPAIPPPRCFLYSGGSRAKLGVSALKFLLGVGAVAHRLLAEDGVGGGKAGSGRLRGALAGRQQRWRGRRRRAVGERHDGDVGGGASALGGRRQGGG
jgi:hypothetical protein